MSITLQSRKKESYKIFDQIAKTYDFLNHFLSFGIDIYWRTKFKKGLQKRNNLKVLDMATGTGDVALTLVKDKRVDHITGIDLSKGMVEIGKSKVAKKNLTHKIDLKIGDAVAIPFEDESFDVVTISFGIRNFSSALESLKNIKRVLRPGGKVMIMEFSLPKNPIVKAVYFFYFRNLLPFIGNLISKHGDAYTYLNQSVEDFPYGEGFKDLMREAGFSDPKCKELTFGISSLYSATKE